MSHWELEIVEAMTRYGGNFIRHLAAAYTAADPENRRLIRETWPDNWEQYRSMAANDRQPQPEEELV